MEKELESALKIKLLHLTCDGADDFWGEIVEWLDDQVIRCDRGLRDVKLTELELRQAQIQRFVCERLKGLPKRLVESLRKQLAEEPDSEKTGLDLANFLKPPNEA